MSNYDNEYYQKIKAEMAGNKTPGLHSNEQGIVGDVIDTVQHGMYKGVAGIGESLGLSDLRDFGQTGAAENRESLSSQAQASLGKEFVSTDENGELTIGEGAKDWRTWVLTTADMIGMNADLLVGGGLVKSGTVALTKIAQFARSKALQKGASKAVADELALNATKAYAKKHNKLTSLSGDVAAYGGAAHLQYGGMQAIDMREEVEAMDWDELTEVQAFRQRALALKAANPNASQLDILTTAKADIANEAANATLLNPALITSNVLLGGLGGKMLESLLKGGGQTLAKVTAEGVTEGMQGATEQYVANKVGQEFVDENISDTQDLLKSGLNEMVAGAAAGGAFAGVGKAKNKLLNSAQLHASAPTESVIEETPKEAPAADTSDFVQDKNTKAPEWNEYNQERYRTKQTVDKTTGEVIDGLPPYMMRKDGGQFTSIESANMAAKHLNVSDKYVAVDTGEGAVLKLKPEFSSDSVKAVTEANGNYQEQGRELITQIMAEADSRKANGEFFNPKQYGQLLAAIAEGKDKAEVEALTDSVFVDPGKAFMQKEQAKLEEKRAKDKERDAYLERVQIGNQRFYENFERRNQVIIDAGSQEDVQAYNDMLKSEQAEQLQQQKDSLEQLELQDTKRRNDEDAFYDKRDAEHKPSPEQLDADYDAALLQKKVNETIGDMADKYQAKPDEPVQDEQVDDVQVKASGEPYESLTSLRDKLKINAKKLNRRMNKLGVPQSIKDKIFAGLAAHKETELAKVEATSEFSAQKDYRPNLLLAESLMAFKPVEKALGKLDAVEAEQLREKVTKAVDDLAVDVTDKKTVTGADVDAAANEAATSPKNDLPEPSQAQKEANNYKLGRIEHSGFNIGIENPKGSMRRGEDSEGNAWSNKIYHHYGDITGTKGADGDALDVFVKPGTTTSDKVYVIDQVHPETKVFDEHKIMLGFNSKDEAEQGYLANYDKGWQGLGQISEVSLDEFTAWTKDGDTTKAFAGEQAKYKDGFQTVASGELGDGIATNEGVEKHKANILADKKVMPIEIDRSGFIVDGEHRYKALMEIGVNDIPVFVGEQMGSAGRLEKPYNGIRVDVVIPEQSTENVDKLVDKLNLEDYKKSVLVTGNTQQHKKALKAAKGLWNKKLGGWIYPQKRKAEIAQLIETINNGVNDESSTGNNVESVTAKSDASTDVGEQVGAAERGQVGRGDKQKKTAVKPESERASSESLPDGSASVVEQSGDKSFYQQARADGLEVNIAGSNERSGGDLSSRPGAKANGKRSERAETVVVSGSGNAELEAKIAAQKAAVDVPYKENDPQNIRDRLPLLHSGQQDDVIKAEQRFFGNNEKGMLFTNGTGTGKTFTAGGIIVRAFDRGAKRVLVVTKAGMIPDYKKDTKLLGLNFHKLNDKRDGGVEGRPNITSYENFADNPELPKQHWDLVLYDESHKIQENMQGKSTNATNAHYKLTNPSNASERHFYWRANAAMPELKVELEATRQRALAKLEKDRVAPTEEKALREYNTKLAIEVDNSPSVKRKVAANEKAYEKLAAQLAKQEETNSTKVVFLSASPFGTVKNIFYADGYLFDSKAGASDSQAYNTGNNEEQYLGNFGYTMRYNKANRPGADVDSGLLEREWMDSLISEGAASYRGLEVDADYSREFVKVNSHYGNEIDRGYGILNDSVKGFPALSSLLYKKMKGGKDRELLEALRVRESIDRMKAHLSLGRKVVVFHERQQLSVPHPFQFSQSELNSYQLGYGEKESASKQYERFKAEYPELVSLDFSDLLSVPAQIAEHFDAEQVAYFSGQNTKERSGELAKFNDDNSDKKILVIQKQSGKEGLSAHDRTGNFQRVLMIMNTPVSPSDAIQMEGRIYRYLVQTNAILEYPIIGNNFEAMSYRNVVAGRTSTAENLARGSGARDMKSAFKEGYLDPVEDAPHAEQGKGGKAADHIENTASAFDKAKTYYWKRAKKNAKNKSAEGKDYFATPEPVGQKMVEWLDLRPGDAALEPSAGHGAIARWLPETTRNIVVEPSNNLIGELGMVTDAKVLNHTFEDFHIMNKVHGVAMNPPFGRGGSDAIPHLAKAFDHLKDGGRVAALIPVGSSADKKFDTWYENAKGAYIVGEVKLPTSTFSRAGTGVMTRIVVIDKDVRGNAIDTSGRVSVDLSREDSVKDLFDRIEHVEMPARPDVKVTADEAGFRHTVKRDNEKGIDIYDVDTAYGGASRWVHGRIINKLAAKHNGERGKDLWGEPEGYLFESENDVNRFYEAVFDAAEKEKAKQKGVELVDNGDTVASLGRGDSASATATVNTVTTADAGALVKRIIANFADAGNGVAVFKQWSSLPSDVREKVGDSFKHASGFLYQGKTYINLEHNKSLADVEEVLVHEMLRHLGFRKLFGRNIVAKFNDIYMSLGERKLKELFAKYNIDYKGYSALYQGKDNRNALMVDELLAHMQRDNVDPADVPKNFWQKVLAVADAIRAWAYDKGFTWLPKYSEHDLFKVISDAHKRITDGEPPNPPGNRVSQDKDTGLDEPVAMIKATKSALDIIGKQSPGTTLSALKNILGNKLSDTRKHWLGALPRRYLADIAGKLLPSVHTYMRQAAQLDADRTDLLTESANIVDAWRKANAKSPEHAQALADLMHDATKAGVDPSKAYEALRDLAGFDPDQKRDANSEAFGEVLTAELVKQRIKEINEQMRGRSGENTAKFMQRIDDIKQRWAFEQNRKKAYPELAARFAKLPKDMQAMFSQVSDHYDWHRKEELKALLARIDELKVNKKQKAALRDQIRVQFESSKVEFYFPLQRFGEYFVRITDGNPDEDGNEETLAFEMFESEFAQQKFIEEQKAIYDESQIKSGKNLQDARVLDQVSGGFVTEVVALLDPLGKAGNEIADQVYQMYLKRLPALSGRKRKIHRKGVAGYHDDALRGFAHNMFHSAYQISKLRHSEAMQMSLEGMNSEADLLNGKEQNKAKDVVGEMIKRHDWIMNPQGGALANKLTSIGFAWYLGVTPAAAATNLTQTPMLALPVIGSRFGYGKTGKALLHFSKLFMQGGHVDKHLEGDELKAFDAFKKSGLIDKTQTHDLAGVAEGGLEYNSNWYKVMKGIGYLFHHAERYNREVTAMSAYKLAREKGQDHDAAVEVATNLTYEAHFDYSNSNKARFMQSDVMKVAFIFRQHSVNMTYRLWRDFHQMFKGETAEVRAQAKRQFAGIIGMTGLFAGSAGMPLYSVLGNLLELLFDDEDEPWEFNTEYRNFLAEHLGVQGGRIAAHGLVDYLTGATVSSRVGMNNLWIRDANREMDGRDTVLHYAEQSLGAVFGLTLSAGRGLDLMAKGQVERGIEAMLPKAIKDVMKAYRYSTEGVQTLRGDNVIAELGKDDIFKQLIGYTPSDVSEQYERNNAIKHPEIRLKRRRSLLINRWALAMRLQDRAFVLETQQEINAFNRKNPELIITDKNKLQSLKRRQANSDKAVNGIVIDKRLSHLNDVVRF